MFPIKLFLAFFTLFLVTDVTTAFWRLPCRARSGLARIDPIVNHGAIGSHVHTIHGGSNFGPDATAKDLLDSDCTSCGVLEDKSAYWTPGLYFIHDNGTAVMLNQVGGMLAYYFLNTDGSATQTITAFPNGFQMIAGDTNRRNFTYAVPEPEKSLWSGYELTEPALRQKALGFNCLNYVDPTKTEGSLVRHQLPDKAFIDANCVSGLRLELMFPSCWNGVDLDSPDHKSHVAYPNLVMTGSCPAAFPVRLPSLFYETIWDTTRFAALPGQFVLANGDPTGYGYHGDFIAAWAPGVLQRAVDQCTNLSGQVQDCPVFSLQDDTQAAACNFTLPPALRILAADDVLGPRVGLPGGVLVQSGPEPATLPVASSSPAVAVAATAAAASVSSAAPAGGLPAWTAVAAAPGSPSSAAAAMTTLCVAPASGTPAGTPQPSSSPPVSSSPAPLQAQQHGSRNFVSTLWSTAAHEVLEIFVELVTVTATVDDVVAGSALATAAVDAVVEIRERVGGWERPPRVYRGRAHLGRHAGYYRRRKSGGGGRG